MVLRKRSDEREHGISPAGSGAQHACKIQIDTEHAHSIPYTSSPYVCNLSTPGQLVDMDGRCRVMSLHVTGEFKVRWFVVCGAHMLQECVPPRTQLDPT